MLIALDGSVAVEFLGGGYRVRRPLPEIEHPGYLGQYQQDLTNPVRPTTNNLNLEEIGTHTVSESTATYANSFASVFDKAAETATTEKRKVEQEIKELEEQVKKMTDEISQGNKRLAEIDDDIALGLNIAAKNAGVMLQLNNGGRKSKPTAGIKRLSRSELAVATSAVMKVLPRQTSKFISIRDIGEKLRLEKDVVKAALRKLKVDQQAVSNGVRGGGSGWRRK